MDASGKQNSAKKVYSRPQLQVYGDLREITQAVFKTGRPDANTQPMNHTQTR
jgi:hypothetical protein